MPLPGITGTMIFYSNFDSGGGGDSGTDEWFKNVVLLSGFEGADGSTSFTDESSFARTLTAGGNAQIDTAVAKFGSSSALFDGTGDYISAADSEDFNFGASNFTWEAWIRFASSPVTAKTIFNQGALSTTPQFYFNATNGRLSFNGLGGSFSETSIWTPSVGVQYHVAVERSGSTVRLYRDGAMVGKTTSTVTMENIAAAFLLGIYGDLTNNAFHGHFDEARITYGIARYDSDAGYTVPTAAFPRTGTAETGDYRYWKVTCSTANNVDGDILFREVEVAESHGGADVAGCGRITGSAGFYSAAEGPDKAINNNTADWWQPRDAGSGVEFKMDFFTKRTLTELRLSPNPSFLTRTPQNITIAGSNDGGSYTTVHSVSGLTSWSGDRTIQW